ncbi:hypothetical protein AKJ42_00685 [candidate division MSBL1 archaeon SCGC-AAA261C02]|uniref:Uncharacterized protein n=1 Tax=candidate division MSBL1 archaeon SCGC-AAA261C02 TaxID=1698272 RepID=A0A133V1V3_9EURY|nr:hypothetical protein AKJ42_00685 [candidate division MSBL1 archaeon SCGC-AAA261C02]
MGLLIPLLTIIFSGLVPYTILSIIGSALFFTGFYLEIKGEDELNLLKWGREYQEYEEEVPMLNFILGAWRQIKRQ